MRATAQPLEGNKVKLEVEVDEVEVEQAVETTFRRLAREVRVPGFRPGKVPRRLLESRMGPGVLRLEALQDAMPDFYARAVRETAVDVIAPPEIDIREGKESGPVSFEAVVEVRPRIQVAGYDGLEVTLSSLEVTDADVDRQIDRLRGQQGHLEDVDRGVEVGDFVTITVDGLRDGEPVPNAHDEDVTLPVGAGRLPEKVEAVLLGAKAGDVVTADAEATEAEAETSEPNVTAYRILLKKVQRQVLPDLTDAWVAENSEFSTVSELRADVRRQLEASALERARRERDERTIEALVALVTEDPPEVLVTQEIERRIHEIGHTLDAAGISAESYLRALGTTGPELVERIRPEAIAAVKADLALRAVADAEGIEVTEDDLDEELIRLAARFSRPVAEVREQLERAEQLEGMRVELRKAKTARWLTEKVHLVDENGHEIAPEVLEAPESAAPAGSEAAGDGEDSGGAAEPVGELAGTPGSAGGARGEQG
jgi:trigger factor